MSISCWICASRPGSGLPCTTPLPLGQADIMSLPLTANVYETPGTESREVAIACRTAGDTGTPVAALPGVTVGGVPVIDMLMPADAALVIGFGEAPADTDASRATHPARTRTEVITSPFRASRRAPPNRVTPGPRSDPPRSLPTTAVPILTSAPTR